MIRSVVVLAAVAALLSPAAAKPVAVVELFTSQGCSSCPPADERLARLARDSNFIALTLPVDYWDYLGWKDTLAQPAFSARQKAYAEARGDRAVYTPQIVVNGAFACIGSKDDQIARAVDRATGGVGLTVSVTVAERADAVTVEVPSSTGNEGPAEVWLLPVVRSREVAIGRGENRGRSAIYSNVVRGLIHLGTWTGASARFQANLADLPETDGFVALVQRADPQGRPGLILGAAKTDGL